LSCSDLEKGKAGIVPRTSPRCQFNRLAQGVPIREDGAVTGNPGIRGGVGGTAGGGLARSRVLVRARRSPRREPVGSGRAGGQPGAPALTQGRKRHGLPRRALGPPSTPVVVREHRRGFDAGGRVAVPRQFPGPAPPAFSRPDPFPPSVASSHSGGSGAQSIPPPRPPALPGMPRSPPGSRSRRKPAPLSGGSSPGTGIQATAHLPRSPAWIESRNPYRYGGPSKPI